MITHSHNFCEKTSVLRDTVLKQVQVNKEKVSFKVILLCINAALLCSSLSASFFPCWLPQLNITTATILRPVRDRITEVLTVSLMTLINELVFVG